MLILEIVIHFPALQRFKYEGIWTFLLIIIKRIFLKKIPENNLCTIFLLTKVNKQKNIFRQNTKNIKYNILVPLLLLINLLITYISKVISTHFNILVSLCQDYMQATILNRFVIPTYYRLQYNLWKESKSTFKFRFCEIKDIILIFNNKNYFYL